MVGPNGNWKWESFEHLLPTNILLHIAATKALIIGSEPDVIRWNGSHDLSRRNKFVAHYSNNRLDLSHGGLNLPILLLKLIRMVGRVLIWADPFLGAWLVILLEIGVSDLQNSFVYARCWMRKFGVLILAYLWRGKKEFGLLYLSWIVLPLLVWFIKTITDIIIFVAILQNFGVVHGMLKLYL
ncbi:hypothetical protein V6N12_003156 [Hibiscus sabdariffa]|uniref:Transmembrane protein n=1 Tax=Hibiscus sabdariffa TaxID=183260 RepID=A0ABR2EB27_9ROSI